MNREIKKSLLGAGLVVVALVLMMIGIANGECATVFNKAVNICMECIGIG